MAPSSVSILTGPYEKTRGASSFNVSIKPNVGYFFNPRLVAGLKLDFINCSLVDNDTGSMSLFDIDYYAINLLMGNGLSRDYMSFKVAPYVRYQVLSLFNDKVKIWAELNGYWGMKYPRDTDHKLDIASRSMIYGAELHPLVSYDLVNNYMIYTSLDFLSLKDNLAAGGNIDAADGIEQRGFSRAVGADDAQGFPFVNRKIKAVDGLQTTEIHLQIFDSHQFIHGYLPPFADSAMRSARVFFFGTNLRQMRTRKFHTGESSPMSPWGMKRTISTSSSP